MTPLVSMFTGNPGSKSRGPITFRAKHFEYRTGRCSRPEYYSLSFLYEHDVWTAAWTDTWLSF